MSDLVRDSRRESIGNGWARTLNNIKTSTLKKVHRILSQIVIKHNDIGYES